MMPVSNEDIAELLEVKIGDNKLLRDRVCIAFLASLEDLRAESVTDPITQLEAQRKQFAQRGLLTAADPRLNTETGQQLAFQPLHEAIYKNFLASSQSESSQQDIIDLTDAEIQTKVDLATALLAESFAENV